MSSAWGPFRLTVWAVATLSALSILMFAVEAWVLARPVLIPFTDVGNFEDAPDALITLAVLVALAGMIVQPVLASLAFGLGIAAMDPRRGRRVRAGVLLGGVLAGVLVVPYLVWSDAFGNDEWQPGAGFYAAGAAVLLVLTVALLLVAYLMVRPAAIRLPGPALPSWSVMPPGWYPDPAEQTAWRWWDGAAWAAAEATAPPG